MKTFTPSSKSVLLFIMILIW